MEALADQLHTGEHVGIACVIDGEPVGEAQHIAAGNATVNDVIAVGNAGTVDGIGHRDPYTVPIDRPAGVHAGTILNALALQVRADFKVSDDVGMESLRDRQHVSHMVKVPVTDKHQVDLVQVFLFGFRSWVLIEKRVDKDDPPRCVDPGRRVSEPRYLYITGHLLPPITLQSLTPSL